MMSLTPSAGQTEEKTLRIVNPETLYDPAPNGYSHIVISQQPQRIAHIAGQGGEDEQGNLKADFEAQVKQAYKNLCAALAAIDAKPEQVMKINTYVVDYDQSKLPVMGEALRQAFGGWLPAQTLVPVPRLALDGMLFEVDAVVGVGRILIG